MPHPCIRNPYLRDAFGVDADPFGNQRSNNLGSDHLVLKIGGLYFLYNSLVLQKKI